MMINGQLMSRNKNYQSLRTHFREHRVSMVLRIEQTKP